MKRIVKSVAKQTGQLARDVARQTLKDIGEIPKQAPKQAAGLDRVPPTSGSTTKGVKLPTLKPIDVKKEVSKFPSAAVGQITGKTPIVSSEEEKKIKREEAGRAQRYEAEIARYRQQREKEVVEKTPKLPEEQRVVDPGESLLPSSAGQRPTGPGGLGRRSKEIPKSKH
ncbi:MAG: hypothetical protein ACC618_02725 [Patescibacteria group bacterium]